MIPFNDYLFLLFGYDYNLKPVTKIEKINIKEIIDNPISQFKNTKWKILDIRETKEKLKLISDLNDELISKELNINNDSITKITTLIKNEINNCFNIETLKKMKMKKRIK